MAQRELSNETLLAWLDEMLPAEEMAAVEETLRNSVPLRRRLAGLSMRRDQGVHSVGEIWRRGRLSCPSRQELGAFLLGTLDVPAAEYIDFHIRTAGCRLCAANLTDLEQAAQSSPETKSRRRKFFQSSAGFLQSGGDG